MCSWVPCSRRTPNWTEAGPAPPRSGSAGLRPVTTLLDWRPPGLISASESSVQDYVLIGVQSGGAAGVEEENLLPLLEIPLLNEVQ